MGNKILLSIAVPTYNRAKFLKEFFDNLEPQMVGAGTNIEVCVSNNGSIDNTRDVVQGFAAKHPGRVRYGENKENLGFDKNVLKAVDMAQGKYIWTFSDDDLFNDGALSKVIGLVADLENKDKVIAGVAVKDSAFRRDEKTGRLIKYHSSVDEVKPPVYQTDFVKIIQGDVPYTGISNLIFNGEFLKKLIKDKPDLVNMGIGTYYFHSWLYLLLLIFNKEAECWVINEDLMTVTDTVPKFKFILEDHFELVYKGNFKFFDNLALVSKGADKKTIAAVKKQRRHANVSLIGMMALFKAYDIPNFASWAKCVKLSFKYLPFANALLVTAMIAGLSIAPPAIVKKTYKALLRRKYKAKADRIWLDTDTQFNYWNLQEGNRRMTE